MTTLQPVPSATASSTLKPRVIHQGENRPVTVLGDNVTFRLRGADTGGLLTLVEQNNPPGFGLPTHVHAREDEVFHVVSGRVRFTVAGQVHVAEAGTTIFAPRNVPHGFVVEGDVPARVLVTIYPSGIEHMFEELSRLPAGPPDLARVADICGRYGIAFHH